MRAVHWKFGHSAFGPKPRNFAVIHYYLDDGGTMNGEFVCMAGYAGTESAWEDLTHRWVDLALKHHLPQAYLHTSDFLSGQGIYRDVGLSVERRLEVLREFIALINTHLHLGAIVGIDAKALRETTKDWPVRFEKNEFCLFRAVRHLTAFGQPLEGALALICDSDDSSSHMLGAYRGLKRRPEFKDSLALIGFGDDKLLQPLQAADLLACVAVNEWTHAYKKWNLKIPRLLEMLTPQPGSRITYSSELWDRAEFERQAPAMLAAAQTSYAARTLRQPS